MSNFIEYDKIGRVYRVSKTEFSRVRDGYFCFETDSKLIDDIVNDKRSMDSVFVYNNEIFEKDGTIYIPEAEDSYSHIKETENTTEISDIKLELFTDNKLLDITINKLSLRLWYHHRMKDNFKFGTSDPLLFLLKQGSRIVQELVVPIDDFLETFKCTIDLSNLDNLEDITISTKKVLPRYILIKQSFKATSHKSTGLFDTVVDHTNTSDMSDTNVEINQINDEITIKSNIKNPNKHKIFDDLYIYITDDDPNILYKSICIPVRDIWFKTEYKVKFNYNIEDMKIFCNLENIKIKVKNEKITK